MANNNEGGSSNSRGYGDGGGGAAEGSAVRLVRLPWPLLGLDYISYNFHSNLQKNLKFE